MLDFTSTILPAWLLWALLAPFLVFYAAHFLLRRRRKQPAKETVENPILVPVIAFDGYQRWVHWFLAATMALFVATGFYIYLWPNAATNPWLSDALVSHEIVAFLLLLLLLVHVYHDALRLRSLHNVSASRIDFRILLQRAKRLLGLGGQPPRGGKYDVFMRGYHWMLTAALGVLGVTGFYFWDPYAVLPSLPISTTFVLLNLHIASAVFASALLLGHVYFALIPENRPLLSAIRNGRLDAGFYSGNYDPELWPPNELYVKSSLLAGLTKSLSKTEFERITGYPDRAVLKRKRIRVSFEAIQMMCGRYKLKEGDAWCSQKRRACAADSCPALGTYTLTKGVTIQEQMVKIQRRKFLTRQLPAVAIVGFFAVLTGYFAEQGQTGNGTTGPPPGPPQPIANLNTMPINSSVDFQGSNGQPSVLIRLSNGTLVAYTRICTHAGCLVDYVSQYNVIYCPCHASYFDPTNGSVLQGPAFIPLPTASFRVDQGTGDVYAY